MSWQDYIDGQLLKAGFMYASINEFETGTLWASSPGFIVSPEECQTLGDALESGSNLGKIQGNGFTVAGQRYTFVRAEAADADDIDGAAYVQGRCKEDGKSSQGILVYRTNQAIIVGVHDPQYSGGCSFGKVNTDIGRLADHIMNGGS